MEDKDKVGNQFLCTLCIRIPFTLYIYNLAKILQNGAKLIQKTNSWFKKSHEEFRKLQTSSSKSYKLKFDVLLLSKKYIPSAKTYTEDLSNITSNFLGQNPPNKLCNF